MQENGSVKEFFQEYTEYCRLHKSQHTYEVDLGRIAMLETFLKERGIKRLRDISPILIENYRTKLLGDCKPKTANHHIALIKAMLNKAIEWKYLKSNPLKNFKKLKETNLREPRFLSETEINKLLGLANPLMQKVIRILLYTSMRRSELVYLTWEDIDFDNKRIIVQSKPESGFHPKSYKPRSIPMNEELEKLMMDLPQHRKYVLDNGKGEPLHTPDYYTAGFEKLLKKAGIIRANLHTLRHTFASYLIMAGVDLRTVQELLGHSTVKVTEKYSHLSPDHRSRAVSKLDFGTKLEQNEPNLSPAPAKSLNNNSGGWI